MLPFNESCFRVLHSVMVKQKQSTTFHCTQLHSSASALLVFSVQESKRGDRAEQPQRGGVLRQRVGRSRGLRDESDAQGPYFFFLLFSFFFDDAVKCILRWRERESTGFILLERKYCLFRCMNRGLHCKSARRLGSGAAPSSSPSTSTGLGQPPLAAPLPRAIHPSPPHRGRRRSFRRAAPFAPSAHTAQTHPTSVTGNDMNVAGGNPSVFFVSKNVMCHLLI